MSFAFTGTALYTGDSGSDIDALTAAGFLVIVRLDSLAANMTFGSKTNGGSTARFLRVTSAGNLIVQCGRATTVAQADAVLTNFPTYKLGAWLVMAGRFDTATAANNDLHVGTVGGALLPPSAYATQSNGSGTVGDDSPGALYIGNNGSGGQPCTVPLFAFVYFKSYPTHGEMQRTANELLVLGRAPRFPASVGRAYRLDRGTGTVVGLATQNSAAPTGTITVAPNPPRRMGGALSLAVPEFVTDVLPEAEASGRAIRFDRRRRWLAATGGA